MKRPRPPPAAMCLLPGPWQDSHPLEPPRPEPSKCSRACGLEGNIRVMLVWQSRHALLPTKVAPSIAGGGAGEERFTLPQETAAAAIAAATARASKPDSPSFVVRMGKGHA